MIILFLSGCQSSKITRAIPNYVVRVVPPLAVYNRLPYATEVRCEAAALHMRIEAGERAHCYTLALPQPHRLQLAMHYMGLQWTGSFTLSPGQFFHITAHQPSSSSSARFRPQLDIGLSNVTLLIGSSALRIQPIHLDIKVSL